ncbi:P-loop containing nucleoside triphosphate hydrolase protein [Patellaria atrata CBS 101060]|uniref:DNA 3'-5' helicase n=1 Tax=Patellaria atrata CBS 101060 TaxID=1346257 RepID=A0A9P4VMX1_9PEZI|nr:P-loop containing nucleoside triphosphate hydrolase protein [Patellaria atrata CBS 101060]
MKAEDNGISVDEGGLFRTTIYRPNLRLVAESTQNKQAKYEKIFAFLRRDPDATIIYVTLQEQAESLAGDLVQNGFKAEPFHTGLQTNIKTQLQEEFMRRDDLVVVATIAFGMSIDKADIRNIVHLDLPYSLEGYSQEIGRTGRDGKLSQCLFYLYQEDFYIKENFARGDLPSRTSVYNILSSIFSSQNINRKVGETIDFSHYQQSQELDIRPNTLSILNTQLELHCGLIRATTATFSSYSYIKKPAYYDFSRSENSAAMGAINTYSVAKIKWCHIDVEHTARLRGIPRADIVRKLQDLNDRDAIELKTSGVINIYRILQELPKNSNQFNTITNDLYAQIQEREQRDLARVQQVVDLITGQECYSRPLAKHFGDDLPNGNTNCGHCTWCETHKRVVIYKTPVLPVNSHPVKVLLKSVQAREDSQFLARIAFGITSPRWTNMRLKDKSAFASMDGCDFLDLLDVFTWICDKDEHETSKAVASISARKIRT